MDLVDKLRGRSLDEVRVRASQAGATLIERFSACVLRPPGRRAWPASFNGLEAVARAFVDTMTPIPGLRNPAATSALLPEPMREAAVLSAGAVLEGRFSLFGDTSFDFGVPPAWHLEPRAGLTIPRRHWSSIDYLDPAIAGDKKIVWELNRQQYLMTLGRAYAATGDERYAIAVLDHIQAWIAGNSDKLGINWASALEVAYRAIAWLWALSFIRTSPCLSPKVLLPAIALLRVAGRHIETYLSTYFSPNTHLTGEALSLYYLGLVLPELAEAPRWRFRGRRILLQHLRRQVKPDGTYFENATYYHRYTLDIYVNAAVLADAAGEPLDAHSLALIESLADGLMAQIKPDGTHGYFGDDDGGRLLPLGKEPLNDFRPALSNAAVLFGRADFKACIGALAEETVWLFGAEALVRCAALPDQLSPAVSRALPDGGIYVMRDGPGPNASQLVVDCGPHGALNCGHAHADALAFELVANGRSLLMDAGTYTYTGDEAARRAFRSTAYHNTLTVDGASSSEPAGPFSWASIARSHLNDWWSGKHIDVFDGSHDGFRRLPDAVDCRREIIFVKGSYWILRDRANGAAPHVFAQHFHFSPDAAPSITADGLACREAKTDAPGLDIASFADGGAWAIEDGWISTRYTDRRPAKVGVFTVAGCASTDILTFLIPRRAQALAYLPTIARARTGRAFVLEEEGFLDLFAAGEGKGIKSDPVASDADWVWLRQRAGRPQALMVRNARMLTLCGEPLLSAPQPVDVSLWRVEDTLDVEFRGDRADIDLNVFEFCHLAVATGQFTVDGERILRLQGTRPKIDQ